MSANNFKRDRKAFWDCLLKLEQLVSNMRVYLDHIKDENDEQILREKVLHTPIHPKIVDMIMHSPTAKTPQQKLAMAKKFQAAKLAKSQVRNAVANTASEITDDEIALSFVNQNTTGQPYRIVPDASGGSNK